MSPVTAAEVALALLAVFGLLGFAWRAWLQHRRTGSTGFRGVSATIGSVEWIAGVGFVVALAVAVVGPLLQLSGAIAPLPGLQVDGIQIAGIALALLGIVLTVWAQLDMGDSWRVGVDASETTALVHTGMFGRVRNPIYTAMLTFDFEIPIVVTPERARRVRSPGRTSKPVTARAHGDCGDPGQDPCTGPVPTVDQVVAIMAELTDPNIPAARKRVSDATGLV